MGALYKGMIVTAVLCAILFYPVTNILMAGNGAFTTLNLYLAAMLGVVVTAGMVLITEYYTGTQYSPVQNLSPSFSLRRFKVAFATIRALSAPT